MLKLPEDIKQAIRNQGLKDHSATAIARINPFKIKEINEKEAKSIRKKLIKKAVAEQWTRTIAAIRVREEIAKLSSTKKPLELEVKPELDNCYKAIKALSVDSLSVEEKEDLLKCLSELVKQLHDQTKSSTS